MYRITLENLRPKMVVARPVYDTAGRQLVSAGLRLDEAELRRMQSLGIGSLYVWSPFLTRQDLPELITGDLRLRAARTVWLTYLAVSMDKSGDGFGLEDLAGDIVREVQAVNARLLQTSDVRAYGDYLYYHVVNVAVLAVKIGIALGYHDGQLTELAQAALLHDIGEMLLPCEVAEKSGKLSPEERVEIHKHPERGFSFLRHSLPQLTAPAAFAVLQHHERMDGSGYPWQLKEKEIIEYARILAVADVFDALTADRPFRPHLPFHEACRVLRAMAGRILDRDLVELLLLCISPYPTGVLLRIVNGEVGVVTQNREEARERPRVRLFMSSQGGMMREERDVELAEQPELEVYRVLPENATIPIANLYAKKRQLTPD